MNTTAAYRLLEVGETVEPSDEYSPFPNYSEHRWERTMFPGNRVTRMKAGRYRRLICASPQPESAPRGWHDNAAPLSTTTERTMTVFRVTIIHTPSPLDAQQGAVESFVLPTVEVLANDAQSAVAQAAFEHHDKLSEATKANKAPARWFVRVSAVY